MIGRMMVLARMVPAWVLLSALAVVSLLGVASHLLGLPHVRLAQAILVVSLLGAGWVVRSAQDAGRSLSRIAGRAVLWTVAVLLAVSLGWTYRFHRLAGELRELGLPASLADLPAAPADAVYAERNMDALAVTLTATGQDEIPAASATSELLTAIHGDPQLKGTPPVHSLHRRPADAAKRIDTFIAKYPAFFRALNGEYARIIDRSTRYAQRDPSSMAAMPWTLEIPKYAHLVNLARCYWLQAEREMLGGNPTGASRNLERILKLTALIETDHLMIPKMIAVANGGIAARATLSMLLNGGPPPSSAVIRGLAGLPMGRIVAAGFADEAAVLLDQRRWLVRYWTRPYAEWMSREEFVIAKFQLIVGLNDATVNRQYRERMIPVALATGWPVPGERQRDEAWLASRAWAGPLIWNDGNLAALYQKGLECEARLRMAVVASAIHGWKAKTGTWPAALGLIGSSLPGPEAIIDPFSGKPFVYEPAAKNSGYTLSSVGPWGDRRDSKNQRLEVVMPLPTAPTARMKPRR